MKIFVKVFLLILFMFAQPCFAANNNVKVLVLPDTLAKKELDAFVYPEASELISNDIVNYLNTVKDLDNFKIFCVKMIMY